MKIHILPLVWNPIDDLAMSRLLLVLSKWRGTRYCDGIGAPAAGANCLRFVTGVLDEMYRRPLNRFDRFPRDLSLHDRDQAIEIVKRLLRMYPSYVITSPEIEPGDVLVSREAGGGPGHCKMVGPEKNTLWEATLTRGVQKTGLSGVAVYQQIEAIYRPKDKESWS